MSKLQDEGEGLRWTLQDPRASEGEIMCITGDVEVENDDYDDDDDNNHHHHLLKYEVCYVVKEIIKLSISDVFGYKILSRVFRKQLPCKKS
jgi:hypothetical protein